jgi:hypothetical protein
MALIVQIYYDPLLTLMHALRLVPCRGCDFILRPQKYGDGFFRNRWHSRPLLDNLVNPHLLCRSGGGHGRGGYNLGGHDRRLRNNYQRRYWCTYDI